MTTRRDLLTGAVAVVAAPLLPIPALAAAPRDPVVALAAEYLRLVATVNAAEDDDEMNAVFADAELLRERMLATPATTLAGILAKVRAAAVAASWSNEDISGSFSLSALDDLERLAAGGAA